MNEKKSVPLIQWESVNGDGGERKRAWEFLRRGRNFVAFDADDENIGFAPSRFAGYAANSVALHDRKLERPTPQEGGADGAATTRAIDGVFDEC